MALRLPVELKEFIMLYLTFENVIVLSEYISKKNMINIKLTGILQLDVDI